MTAATKQSKRTARPRRDVEAEVTQMVIESLERGTVPWSKPWVSAWGETPTSVATGRPYRGVNALILWIESTLRNYESPYWMTFNQAKERGGSVRKGETGTLVVFWKKYETKDKDSDDPEATKKVFVLRHFIVFNEEQTEGVTLPPRFARPEPRPALSIPDAVGEVIDEYEDGPTYVLDSHGDSANYESVRDVVTIPEADRFDSPERYAATVFHETVHSTGHPSRLDRPLRNHFGSERYAQEELVAEIGSAMIGGIVGVGTEIEQTAAYVANWLQALRDDKSLVVKAAQQAQRAVDRVLGTDPAAATADEHVEAVA